MSIMSESMSFERMARIPRRVANDIKIIRLTKNWREVLAAKAGGRDLRRVYFRNGAVLDAPAEIDLLFLFHEVWIDRIYDLPGFEIKAGDDVIDIGGNIGAFAVFAGKRAENVKIHSYEPFPMNAAFLRKNVENSGLNNVNIIEAAVAGNNGERTLKIDDSWVKHSLNEISSKESGIRIKCLSLDEVLTEIDHCNLLKIDCEGGEYEIFYGAKPETLRSIDKIVCEYHDGEHGTGKQLKDFFEANSFRADIFKVFDTSTGLICLTNIK